MKFKTALTVFIVASVLSCATFSNVKETKYGDNSFQVEVTLWVAPEATRSLIIMPPTGGTNYIDRSYAKYFSRHGYNVYVLKTWTDMNEQNFDLEIHQRFYTRALKAITLAGVLKYSGVPLLPFGSTMRFLARCLLLTVACGGAAFGGLKIVERVQGKSAETSTELRQDPKEREEKERAEKDADAKKSDGKEAPEKKAPTGSGMKALLRAAPQLVFPGLLTLIVFIAGCKLLRLDELDEMIGYAREKIRRRGKGSAMPTDAGAA